MRRQISQPPQDATEDKGLNVGTSKQRQLKLKCNVHFKNTVCGKVSPGPFPYLCQAPAENDNRIWQLKSRSGGKKLLLLPNFDQFKHSRCNVRLSSRCILCTVIDCRLFPYKRLFFSIQRHINPVLMYVSFLKKKQQTMPDFLQQPNQHVRLPVQTPRRSNFKMSSTAHAHTETHSKSSQTATAACCCSHMFQLQSLNFVV